jgi:dipeptidase E
MGSDPPVNLLLLSNSRNPGGDYLGHALSPIAACLGERRRGILIPFANLLPGWDGATATVTDALAPLGVEVVGAHTLADPAEALARAEFVAVAGGNTFRLLAEIRARGWLEPLRSAVGAGLAYIGWSAGSVLASPTISTTNDMPIVDPKGFDGLGLVPFQINAHYTDRVLERHGGESREQRLREYLELAPEATVIGLPEGAWIRREGERTILEGAPGAVVFRRGEPIRPLASGELDLDGVCGAPRGE